MPGAPPTPAQNGQTTTTGTTSTTAPPSTGAPESKGKSFLENKPLAGFVFGLAGLAALVIAIVAVTSYVRRRKQKRLLTDFSFDPKGVEGETSAEEKYSHSGLGGYHNTGHGHGDYPFDARARSVPFSSPPTPAYIVPHDYAGHDGGYPTGHHNPSNAAVGYNLTPNPYDMYGSRDDRRYSNGQDQYDIYNPYGLNGDRPSVTNTGIPVPRQLQPGAHPARGRTFAPPLSTGLPPFNRSPLTPSTILPPPVFLQPSASDQHDILRLPTPGRGALPDTFGRRESGDDDAYSGVFLGGDPPPPEPRRLQVNWPESTRIMRRY